MLPAAVLWVDPGGMTGLARYYSVYYKDRFWAAEYPFHGACDMIEDACSVWRTRLVIGWEQFVITPKTHKLTPQPDALHVIGVCRYLAGKYGCRVLPEGQRHTPTPRDRRRLQALGWWVPGKDDAQSAACHMLLWLEQSGELPPREREILAALQGRQD